MNFRQVFVGARKKIQTVWASPDFFSRFLDHGMVRWHRCEANPTMVLTALQSESQAQRAAFWVKFQMPMCWMDSPSPPSTECKVYHGVWSIFRLWNFNLKLHGFATVTGGGRIDPWTMWTFSKWSFDDVVGVFSFRPVNYLRWGLSSCSLDLVSYQVGPVTSVTHNSTQKRPFLPQWKSWSFFLPFLGISQKSP